MEIDIRKWGNSLGVRIQKIIAKDLNLKDGSFVEIEDNNGTIVISPKKNSLTDLLEKVNDSNLHSEFDFGKTTGKEIW